MALSSAVRDAFNKGNGGGRQAALPDNTRVRVTIQPSKKGIGYIEREPFSSKPESPNHRIQALRLRLVAPEGTPHANRNFFANVPNVFEIWSERAGAMTPSYQSIGLVKALGYSLEDVEDDTLQKLTDRELLGKTLEIVVGVESDPRFNPADPEHAEAAAKNPLAAMRNTVKFINKASASAPQAAVPAGGPAAQAFPGQVTAAYAAPAVAANDPWAGAAAAAATDPWAAAAAAAPATV